MVGPGSSDATGANNTHLENTRGSADIDGSIYSIHQPRTRVTFLEIRRLASFPWLFAIVLGEHHRRTHGHVSWLFLVVSS